MKSWQMKVIVSGVLACMTVLAPGCRSIEFTFFGFYQTIYNKPKVSNTSGTPLQKMKFLQDTTLTVSGLITDSLKRPARNVEIYLMKGKTIEYHAITGTDGGYTIKNVNAATYYFYLAAPQENKHQKLVYNLPRGMDHIQIDIIF
jgi:hypothetical protein